MRIQHNINALNAHRQLGINNTSVGKNLEKLSSGFRINRAGDDAAGLAISEKMRGQIRGLDMASSNAQDGISLIQTAEGNLQETHSILQRMRELAVQSSNGTFEDANDRVNIDKEVQALKKEIDRIASSAHFNNQKLLDGSLGGTPVDPAKQAIATKIDATTQDGAAANAGVKGVYEIDLAGMTFTAAVATTLTINGVALTLSNPAAGDEIGGTNSDARMDDIVAKYNASTDAAHSIYTASKDGTKLVLTAKNAGEISAANKTLVDAGVSASTNTGTVTANTATTKVTGQNAGAATAATRASYLFKLDFTKLQGGDTLQIGNKFITFSTKDATNGATGIVNIADATSAAGKGQIMTDLKTVLDDAAGGVGTVNYASVIGAAGSGELTLTAVAGFSGKQGNLGEVRMSNSAMGSVNNVTRGQDAGIAQTVKFATATLDINFANFKAGDKITLNGTTFEAVSGKGTIDPTKHQFKINNANADDTTNAADAQANFIGALNAAGSNNVGLVTYAANAGGAAGGKLTFTATDYTKTSADFAKDLGAVTYASATAVGGATGGVTFQIGANGTQDDRVNLQIAGQDTATLGIAGIDVTKQGNANAAIDLITAATNTVSGTRADLGALQNRLEHTVANLGTTSENLTAAESRIRDVDMAKEMMEMTKNNILSQAAQAMLAQANQQPQGILQLLR